MDTEEGRGDGESHASGEEVVEPDDGFEEVGGDGEGVELARRFIGEGEGFEQDSMDTNTWTIEHEDVHDIL